MFVSLALLSAPLSHAYAGDNQGQDRDNHPGPPKLPQCCVAAGKDFPMVNANYGNTMYSSLLEINRFTIGKLGGAWQLHVDGGAISGASQQATPVEVDGVIYVQSALQSISAVDARTGVAKWTYAGGGTVGIVRGVAAAQGRVFASLTGRRVVALDQATGQQLWQITLNDANSVLLGVTSATGVETNTSQNAIFPQNLLVPAGTLVTFVNPATNASNHCTDSFFDREFDRVCSCPDRSSHTPSTNRVSTSTTIACGRTSQEK